MPAQRCARCSSENTEVTSTLPDGRNRYRCMNCRLSWWAGSGRRAAGGGTSKTFPRKEELTPEEGQERFEMLVRQYQREGTPPTAEERAWRDRYREHFSREGLEKVAAADLKAFASAREVANPGPMTVFNTAWNEMGDEQASGHVRRMIGHILYGEGAPLEQRLTDVIDGNEGLGMAGFKTTLATKVLCVVQAERFVPILPVKGKLKKTAFLQHVWGVAVSDPRGASVGELIVWSNDLLRERLEGTFPDLLDGASFLGWARTQP